MSTPASKMTVVFARKPALGALTIRTSARHYASAIDYAADECVDIEEDDYVEAPEEMDHDVELAKQAFLDNEVEAIRVYAGWPPAETDDVSSLEMIHTE